MSFVLGGNGDVIREQALPRASQGLVVCNCYDVTTARMPGTSASRLGFSDR